MLMLLMMIMMIDDDDDDDDDDDKAIIYDHTIPYIIVFLNNLFFVMFILPYITLYVI